MNPNSRIRSSAVTLFITSLALGLGACGNEPAGAGDDDIAVVQGAVTVCTPAAPVVTEIREEQPGNVAPGVGKIYFVTVRNADSAGCSPATVTFTPDSFHFFSIVAQPSSAGGVSPGSTVQFRVTITQDASVPPETTVIGFTVIKTSSGGTNTTRGSITFTTTLDNPLGCNRQRPAIQVDNRDPAAVTPGTTVTYRATVRNVDNRECGQDVFTLAPNPAPPANETFTTDGPFTIVPQGSATFTVTIRATVPAGTTLQQCFDVTGQRHPAPNLSASDCVRYRTR